MQRLTTTAQGLLGFSFHTTIINQIGLIGLTATDAAKPFKNHRKISIFCGFNTFLGASEKLHTTAVYHCH